MVVHVSRSGNVGGTPFKEYYGTLTMGKELAIVENNDRGDAIGRVQRMLIVSEPGLYKLGDVFWQHIETFVAGAPLFLGLPHLRADDLAPTS